MADERQTPGDRQKSSLVFASFCLDPVEQQLWHGDRLVALQPKAFAVLQYLLEHPGRLIRHEEFLARIWGAGTHLGDGVLKTQIAEIRQALGDSAREPRFIATSPRRGYRFIGQVAQGPGQRPALEQTAPEARSSSSAAAQPFVGRGRELAQLLSGWRLALQGKRQVIFVTGEAGVGKTGLVRALLASPLGDAERHLALWGQCVDQYGAGEPYLPVIEALRRACREVGSAQVSECVALHAPYWLTAMTATAEPVPSSVQDLSPTPGAPERTLRQLAETFEALASATATLLLLEDVHWADNSTLDLLSYLAQRSDPARLLVVATLRPTEASATRLAELVRSLEARGRCVLLPVPPLSQSEVVEYVDRRFPHHRLPSDVPALIHGRTEGNPLFMLGVVATWLEQSLLVDSGGACHLEASLQQLARCVPDTFVRLIEHELAASDELQRNVLEAASVAGNDFCTAAVAAALAEDVVRVEEVCLRWARRGQYFRKKGQSEWRDGTTAEHCEFLHVLYQQVIYDQIGAARRAQLHARLAERLRAGYGPDADSIAPELALHFERGLDFEQAVRYLRSSGESALRQSAYREAVEHFLRAISLLQRLPESPERAARELALQILVAPPLSITRGHAAAEVAFARTRAVELCKALGRKAELLSLFLGVAAQHLLRGEYRECLATGEDFLRLAETEGDACAVAHGHLIIGGAFAHTSDLPAVQQSLELGFALRAASPGHLDANISALELRVAARYFLGRTKFLMGYLDQARYQARQCLLEAEASGSPYAVAFGLLSLATIHMYCRQPDVAEAYADTLRGQCARSGFEMLYALSAVAKGGAQIEKGELAEGIQTLRTGFDGFQATGGRAYIAIFTCLLANAYGKLGQPRQGLEVLLRGGRPAADQHELWDAEFLRIEGELLLQTGERRESPGGPCDDEVRLGEERLVQALQLARTQGAKLLELRAAKALARRWAESGRAVEGRALLGEIYSFFAEGLELPDLAEARALLDALA